MTRDQWKRIKDLALGALAEPESARDAYLAARCLSDDVLRDVKSLIASMANAADLFETPKLAMAGARATLDLLDEIGPSRIGERVGPYRLVKELGNGGMGTAYLALRADGAYEKSVAIKLIKRGMDTTAVLRRFHQECQILANLDHPNIARLLDGGTTSDGLPYLVMEYIDRKSVV